MKINKLLILIVILGFVLRFYNLDLMPPHIRNDEAALGFNAYSILKTGRDEHGEYLPIILKSFGDYKPGLYSYLSIPFIYILGLNEFSIRIVSALAGVLSIYFFYLLLKSLLDQRIALVGSFLLAISPWHLSFSRGAWEANLSLFFQILGSYLFIKGVKEKPVLLIISAVSFGLTMLTSHGAKLSTPIVVCCLVVAFYKELMKVPIKVLLISVLIGLALTFPIVLTFTQGKTARIEDLSIFSYPRDPNYINSQINPAGETNQDLTFYIFHNEPFSYLRSILVRYLNHYSPSVLFIQGDKNPQHTAPNIGPFLLLDLVFLLIGLKVLFSLPKRVVLFLVSLLILTPLPSAFTIESVNFERTPVMLLSYLTLITLGASYLIQRLFKKKILFWGVIAFCVVNILFTFDAYFIHGYFKNDAWQTGYKEIVNLTNKYPDKNITIQQSGDQPYIFFLFFNHQNPNIFNDSLSKEYISNPKGMGSVEKVGRIKINKIEWDKNPPQKGDVFVMRVSALSEQSKYFDNFKVLEEIKDPLGFPIYKFIEVL